MSRDQTDVGVTCHTDYERYQRCCILLEGMANCCQPENLSKGKGCFYSILEVSLWLLCGESVVGMAGDG